MIKKTKLKHTYPSAEIKGGPSLLLSTVTVLQVAVM